MKKLALVLCAFLLCGGALFATGTTEGTSSGGPAPQLIVQLMDKGS